MIRNTSLPRWIGVALAAGLLSVVTPRASANMHEVKPEMPSTVLSANDSSVALGSQLQIFHDTSASMDIRTVMSDNVAAQFKSLATSTINLGFTTDTYWYRTRLINTATQAQGQSHWVLEFKYPMLDHVDVYLVRPSGMETILTGDQRHNLPPPRQLSHRTLALPFELEPGASLELYLRVQTTGDHDLASAIWTRTAFQNKAETENLYYGIFYGIMLVMTLYNLIVFISIRDRAYLYYVLYTASILITIFFYGGHARQFLNEVSERAPAFINLLVPILIDVTLMFGALFGRKFMQLHQHAPLIHRITGVLIIAAAVFAFLIPFLPISLGLRTGSAIGVVSLLLLLTTSIRLAFRGIRPAQLYLVAWSPFIIMFVLGVIETFGLIPGQFPVREIALVGGCIDVTILSLALADRINTEKHEKFEAQSEALLARTQALSDAHRVERLKTFLPQRVAEMVVEGDGSTLLAPKRREVTVCVMDLRDFTPFAESTLPEEIVNVLRDFFETMGNIVEKYGGAVEHFAGDSMLVFFNAPIEIPDADARAVRAAVEMQAAFASLRAKWAALGYQLGLGIGIASGIATVGAIGFSGRSQYAAIGSVTNLAARLCSIAAHGDILTTTQVFATTRALVEADEIGERTIKGFQKPVNIYKITTLKTAVAS